ncbi:hypothetical protein C8Q80DRAFT_1264827 [Daedaleopsis nitida]|nr:hypothetical protein C8Q80DRAFT_1264827 [Daedaleopsis nitida]
MDPTGVLSRPELPVELYTHTLSLLPPEDASTLKTLFSVLWTSTYLRAAASASVLWKPHYTARYTQCSPENDARRRAQHGDDYFKLYMARRELDHRALTLVDEIRRDIVDRSARARVLARELSFDVWDALRAETVLPLPKYFRSMHDSAKEVEAAPEALPRRYWAKTALGVIARYWAVRMWQRTKAGDQAVTFEEVLAGFSAFFGWSPYSIAQTLDQIAQRCRETMVEQRIVLDQMDAKFDLVKVCDGIIFAMRSQERWIDHDNDTEYDQHLLNIYPHVPLSEEIYYNMSELCQTWFFVALARRLGLDVYPTIDPSTPSASPGPVICCVRPSNPEGVPVVVSFSPTATAVPVTQTVHYRRMRELLSEDLPIQLAWACVPPLLLSHFLLLALVEASNNLKAWKESDFEDACMIRYKDIEAVATYALGCLYAVVRRADDNDAVPSWSRDLAEALPLDGQVIVLDVLLTESPLGPTAEVLAGATKELVVKSEDLSSRVMRRSQYPDRPDIPRVGAVIERDLADSEGFILDWKVIPEYTGPDQGKSILWERRAFNEIMDTTRNPQVLTKCYDKFRGMKKESARRLYLDWEHFGRYVEDVSFAEVDPEGNPLRLVMTAEMRMLYPEDGIPEPAPYVMPPSKGKAT